MADKYHSETGFPGSIHVVDKEDGKEELWVQLNDPMLAQVDWIRLGELLECIYDDNLYDIDLLYELIDKWKKKNNYVEPQPPSFRF